jgi:hypothetical protein
MKLLMRTLPLLALGASCSQADDGESTGERPLCSAEVAGAVTAAKATELMNAVRQSDGTDRGATCARFKEVIQDGSKVRIPSSPHCRWDNRNSNGNPHFLISLHLTQLKGQAREICGKLD